MVLQERKVLKVQKSTPYAAQVAADDAGAKAFEQGLRTLTVQVKGPGSGRETALRSLQSKGFKILSIKDTTPMPHNEQDHQKKESINASNDKCNRKNGKHLLNQIN